MTETVKILHVADLHLGASAYEKPGRPRLAEFLAAVDRTWDLAADEDVDAILVAGDVFDGYRPDAEVEREWAARVSRLIDEGVPLAVVPGNHDAPARRGAASHLDVYDRLRLESVHVFSLPDVKTLATRSGPLEVVGVPWPFRGKFFEPGESAVPADADITDQLEGILDDVIMPRLDSEIPTVLLAHLWLREGSLSSEKTFAVGPDPIIPASAVVRDEFAYAALGHLHRHQELPGTDGRAVYAGGLSRISFGDEGIPKGAVVAEVSTGGCSWRFVELPSRTFKTIAVEVETAEEAESKISDSIGAFDPADAVVRLLVRGPAAVLSELARRGLAAHFPGAFGFKAEFERTDEHRAGRPSIAEDATVAAALEQYAVDHRPPKGVKKEEVISAATELERRVEGESGGTG
ncbi:MAG: exonuclease SbcCD subunit D [Candidatus Coatesbacteria bacterium]|nr:MAG: exonuclease SbcCD subunit D [Candidatus Coatesbacteria bacterium]